MSECFVCRKDVVVLALTLLSMLIALKERKDLTGKSK